MWEKPRFREIRGFLFILESDQGIPRIIGNEVIKQADEQCRLSGTGGSHQVNVPDRAVIQEFVNGFQQKRAQRKINMGRPRRLLVYHVSRIHSIGSTSIPADTLSAKRFRNPAAFSTSLIVPPG